VIGESHHHAGFFYAFGHGHLGLTQAATTGRLIVERLQGQKTTVDLTPFRVGRFRNRED
jgi:D-amino-acid dehydrogenase